MASTTHQSEGARAADPFLPALLLVIAFAVALRLYLLFTAHATEEDFYITLRYAENIAHGQGFVFNLGARTLGTTTPLYTLFLALTLKLHLDAILIGKLAGIGADALACYAVYRLGRVIGRPGAGLAAAVCLSVLPTNLIWATKGMEVGIVSAVVIVTWTAWAEGREMAAWAAAAVLVLLRIDGAALAVLMLLATLARERRMPWRGLALFAALLLPWFSFATLYFGSPVPISIKAKLIVYGRNAHGAFPRLAEFLSLMLHRAGGAIALGCVFAFAGAIGSLRPRPTEGIRRSRSPDEWLLIPAGIWMLTYYGSMAFSKVFLFGWYFVPPTPIYYLISMSGWSLALGQLFKRRYSAPAAPARRIAALTALATALSAAATLPPVLRDLRETQQVEEGLRIPIGRWLHDHARSTDTVMLEPIGYIGYYSGLRVLDTVGLVSPEVLPLYDRRVPFPHHEMWKRFAPRWILLRAGEWDALQRYESTLPPEQRLISSYRQVDAWSDPSYPGSAPSFYLFRRLSD